MGKRHESGSVRAVGSTEVDQNIAKAMEVIHKGAGRDGSDTNAPTTFLIDDKGQVQWFFRPDRHRRPTVNSEQAPLRERFAAEQAWRAYR